MYLSSGVGPSVSDCTTRHVLLSVTLSFSERNNGPMLNGAE